MDTLIDKIKEFLKINKEDSIYNDYSSNGNGYGNGYGSGRALGNGSTGNNTNINIGTGCSNVEYYGSYGKNLKNTIIEAGCRRISLHSNTLEEGSILKNFIIRSSCTDTTSNNMTSINIDPYADRDYNTIISRNSSGVIKIFCDADLVP